ncbi:MAG: nucleotidyltransferase [Alphaproteobacteria bacterium]|nr:nucleotidyltransferase [Alphaproteobacteria bacterium]
MKPTLFILAAGMGSRYGGLKQLDGVGVGGETIMDYSVYDAVKAGFGKVVFVIGKHFENDFRQKVLSKYQNHVETVVVFQSIDILPDGFAVPVGREKPWGTNHAVIMAKDVIKEPFLVINADDFYGYDTFKKAAEFLSGDLPGNEYCMIGFKLCNTLSETGAVSRGVCEVGTDGYLKKITERKEIIKSGDTIQFKDENGGMHPVPSDAIVSMNAWGFTKDYFEHSEKYFRDVFLPKNMENPKSEFFIPLMVDDLINSGTATVRCIDTDADWFGVTYAEDRPSVVQKLKNLVDSGEYPKKLF